MGNRTKTIVVAATAVAMLATPVAASAVEREPGATFFEDNSCQEADGTPGLTGYDGQCVTADDYDYLFSFEALDSIQSLTQPDLTVAEEAGITSEDNPASERILGAGLVPAIQQRTFADNFQPTGWQSNPYHQPEYWVWTPASGYVLYLYGLPIRLA